ncbi:MAG: hypothetical protein WDO18_15355 [Acidobacteriota bacterium]
MIVLAAYFLLCLRLDHFKGARATSTSKQVFATLACLSEEHGLNKIAASTEFAGPLNLYRRAADTDIVEIVPHRSGSGQGSLRRRLPT